MLKKCELKNQRLQKGEVGHSRNNPITHFATPSIFETKDLMFGATLKVNGVAHDTANAETLNWHKEVWHQALLNLGEEFMVYVTTHRHSISTHLTGNFKTKFADDFNMAYQNKFKNKKLYINDIYITVLLKGHPSGKMGKGIQLFNKLSQKISEQVVQDFRKRQIEKLTKAVNQLLVDLNQFSPRLLKEKNGNPELLTFLGILVNGGEIREFRYPYENIATYIPTKRIFFGYDRTIQWLGDTAVDTRFAAVLSIKHYVLDSTTSKILDPLMEIECDYISTHSFQPKSNDVSLETIRRHQIKMEAVNDPAISQYDNLEVARDLIASHKLMMGFHHHSLLVFADTKKELEDLVTKITKVYSDAKLVIVREQFNMELAYWAQIPGNAKMIARKAFISSENFVDFCSLHNYYVGYINENHLGLAVTVLETPAKTPFFFNFHARGSGSSHDKTSGITTIIGMTGSGKTTLQLALNAQLHRYGGRTFIFDRDRSSDPYVRAMGGYYAIFKPKTYTGLNPCQLPDTPENRDFLKKLFTHLAIDPQENKPLSDDDLEEISRAVNANYELLPKEQRNLSNIVKFFSVDFSGLKKFYQWTRATDMRVGGDYDYLFDNDKDTLELHDIMGFDMTHLLDKEPMHVMQAVVMYLLHVIDQSLDGRLVCIIFEEGWQYLNNKFWQVRMEKYIPTWRKYNCFPILATQLPGTVMQSPLGDHLIQNSATNIYMPNPKAKEEDYILGFKLSQGEFDFIKHTIGKRKFLIKKGHESVICSMDLNSLEDFLCVLSPNPDTVKLLDSIRARVGDDPEAWLPEFRHTLCREKV